MKIPKIILEKIYKYNEWQKTELLKEVFADLYRWKNGDVIPYLEEKERKLNITVKGE